MEAWGIPGLLPQGWDKKPDAMEWTAADMRLYLGRQEPAEGSRESGGKPERAGIHWRWHLPPLKKSDPGTPRVTGATS